MHGPLFFVYALLPSVSPAELLYSVLVCCRCQLCFSFQSYGHNTLTLISSPFPVPSPGSLFLHSRVWVRSENRGTEHSEQMPLLYTWQVFNVLPQVTPLYGSGPGCILCCTQGHILKELLRMLLLRNSRYSSTQCLDI